MSCDALVQIYIVILWHKETQYTTLVHGPTISLGQKWQKNTNRQKTFLQQGGEVACTRLPMFFFWGERWEC
jgi:hypothetical protein